MNPTHSRWLPALLLLLPAPGLAATITVNDDGYDTLDDGKCTLLEAVQSASFDTASGTLAGECAAGATDDTIVFDLPLPATISQPFPLNLSPNLGDSVLIDGPGMDLLTISGTATGRILRINSIGEVRVHGLTFSLGLANDSAVFGGMDGGAVLVDIPLSPVTFEAVRFADSAAAHGGGAVAIVQSGATGSALRTFRHCHFVNNTALGSAPNENGFDGGGGAMYVGADVNVLIEDSTFENNQTVLNGSEEQAEDEPPGGAIWMISASEALASTLTIRRSTFSGNSAVGTGGALAVGGSATAIDDFSEVVVRHSTITDNHADSNDNDHFVSAGGIRVLGNASVTLGNNLIAGNRSGDDQNDHDLVGTFTSDGYNLIGDNRGSLFSFASGTPNANNDTVGQGPTGAIDPMLDALDMHGGLTATHRPGDASPAVDQGRCPGQVADQRGYFNQNTGTRAVDFPAVNALDDACDIGAYERQAAPDNEPPVAVDDGYSVLEDLLFSAQDVDGSDTPGFSNDDGLLANDIDPDSSLIVSNNGSFPVNADGGSVDLGSDGGFFFQGPPDFHGLASFTYTASDGFNSDTATVFVSVLPVNDAPVFTPATSVITLVESAGPQSIPAWASGIDPGASDEFGQALMFTVDAEDDGFFSTEPTVDALSGDLDFTIADGVTGNRDVVVLLSDDGGTDNGGVDSTQHIVNFTVVSSGSGNAAPVANNDDQYTVREDHLLLVTDIDGQTTPDFSGDDGVLANDTDPDSTLFVTSGGTFAASGSGGDVNLAADGRFRYQPPGDAYGTASFDYSVSDGIDSDTATASVTILPVNDAPRFEAGPTRITLTESAGAQTISAWANGIDAGAANESGQALAFNISIVDAEPGFFAVAPSVDPLTGDLAFTASAGVTGSARLSVVLADDGGTEHAGVDSSEPVNLTIHVNSSGTSSDLSITKDNHVDEIDPQVDDVLWDIQIQNHGPDPVVGVAVVDLLPAAVTDAEWSCFPNTKAKCSSSGLQTGDVHEVLDMAVDGAVLIRVRAAIDPSATGNLTNTATLVLPDDVVDPTTGDHSSSDTDLLIPPDTMTLVFGDGFEDDE